MKGIAKKQKNPKKIQKISKNFKKSKIQKSWKNPKNTKKNTKKNTNNTKNTKKFQISIKKPKSKNCQKWSKNTKIWKNLKKSLFFKKSENFEFIFCSPKKRKENAILLVLPIEEISLRPELSSPARFRIQGGSPERDGGAGRRTNEGNPRV